MPFTNAGEFTFNIEEETKDGGTQGDIFISSHVLSNQRGTLLTRKKTNERHQQKQVISAKYLCNIN